MADDPQAKKPVGRVRRGMRLAGMTASLAGRYAGVQLKSAFQSAEEAARTKAASYKRSGEHIAETLGDLKGAAMKIGQMASIAGDVLPKELSEALTKLQKGAPPVPYQVIEDQIIDELGSPPEMLFEWFDPQPFAAASIGQVHRARVDDGREVVVKVQYPGVDTSVDSDLAHLKLALRASGLVHIDRASYNALFTEIKARLYEELDYCNEADNVRLFRDFHKDNDQIIVPDVVGERSSQRMLTLTFEDGDNINDLEAKGYPQETRNRIGLNLWSMMLDQLFDLRSIHADPNPANFAFRRDGKIVMYDFGCVKKLSDELIEDYADTIYAGLIEDYDAVHLGLHRLGVLRSGGPRVENEYYKRWRDLLYLPFAANEEFDYATATVHDDMVKMIPGAMKRMASFGMPVNLVFIDRVIGGHYGNLRLIKPKGRFLDLIVSRIDGTSPAARRKAAASRL